MNKAKPSFTWLFYTGFILFLLAYLPLSPTESTKAILKSTTILMGRMGAGLLALRIMVLFPRHPRYVLASICMLVISRFSSYLGGTKNLFCLILIVAASQGADTRLTLKCFLAYLVFNLAAAPVAFTLGWADNVKTHFGQLLGGSFGFDNPNLLAVTLSMTVFLGLYLSRERRWAVIWAICWAGAALCFFLTYCLTWTLLLLVMPAIYLFTRRMKVRPWLPAVLPVMCLLVSIALACFYGPGYGSSTFGSRFSIAALVYEKCGLSLFGQDCGLTGWFHGEYPYNLALDNGYLGLFLRDGVVSGLAGMAFLVHLCYLIGKKSDALLIAIACCIITSGMMEQIPFHIRLSFLPLFYIPLAEEFASSKRGIATSVPIVFAFVAAILAFMPWHPRQATLHPNGTVGEIPCPAGFCPIEYAPDSFSSFVQGLPLAKPDSMLTNYDGTPRDSLERFCYRIVDLPLINENEQCADVCMYLRAEFLYEGNHFRKIHFADTRGKTLRYYFGAARPLFERYLKEVFLWSNTESLRNSMSVQSIGDLIPGDVLVYDTDSRPNEKYGHAVMVAAVAVDTVSAQKAVLLIQGSTPACDIHVVANPDAPDLSPWHLLTESEDSAPVLSVGRATFYAEDLRHF